MNKDLRSISLGERRLGFAFLTPALAFLMFFIFLPIIYSVFMSFFEWSLFDLGKNKIFVGFANYLNLISDKIFLTVLLNTIAIVFGCLLAELLVGFFVSLTLWNIKRTLKGIQSLILLPMITSPVIVGLIWRFIYDPLFGILNFILRSTLGISNVAWLGDTKTALFSVMVVDIWQMTSFVIIILYAGMISIPDEYIEAAQVDGTSYWQTVRYMVLPSISKYFILVMMMRAMDLFKIFDTVYTLTNGGPGYATETLSIYTYKTSFVYYNMGYAMVLSLVSLVIIMFISLSFLRLMKNKD